MELSTIGPKSLLPAYIPMKSSSIDLFPTFLPVTAFSFPIFGEAPKLFCHQWDWFPGTWKSPSNHHLWHHCFTKLQSLRNCSLFSVLDWSWCFLWNHFLESFQSVYTHFHIHKHSSELLLLFLRCHWSFTSNYSLKEGGLGTPVS